MSGDETIRVSPMGMADMTHAMVSFSQELDSLGQEAHNLLATSQEYFTSHGAGQAYQQVQNLVNQGIADGQQVIQRHGNAVDTAAAAYHGTDMHNASGFQSI